MLHSGSSNNSNGFLHGDSEHPVHLEGNVLDGGLRDFYQGALDDRVLAEDSEVGFGDDLELHPGYLAEELGELLVSLNDNESAALDAEACAEVKATIDVVFLVTIICGHEALDGEEPSIEGEMSAFFAEAVGIPLKLSVYIADVLVKINADVVYASVLLVEITVEESASENGVPAGVLNKIFLTLAERQKLDR